MKKLFVTMLLLMACVGMLFGQFAAGDGSEGNPYQITTAEQLNNVRDYLGEAYSDKHFMLVNDIDLTAYLASGGAGHNDGAFWEPIGYVIYDWDDSNHDYNFFYGKFDGNNKKIIGLKINRTTTNFVGLFGVFKLMEK